LLKKFIYLMKTTYQTAHNLCIRFFDDLRITLETIAI